VFVAACGDDDKKDSSGSSATTTQPADSAELSAEEKAANKIKPVAGAASTSITVGSKNFPEQFILGEIYAQALDAAGYKVKKDLDLGSELIAYKAVRDGNVDAYPEYTGTSLTSFFKVKLPDVPKEPQQAYGQARAAYAKVGITALPPTPFENTYRMGMTKAGAAKFGNPTKISDLADEAKDMTVNGYPECRQRTDCLLGVQQTYGLKFKKFLPGQNPYQTLDNGDADVAFVFTTDGPLASDKYVVLDDDKKLFPPYNISFTVRDEVAKKLGPDGQQVVQEVQKYMTEEVMQELNARFSVDKKKADEIAGDYLKQFGFTS
ncbi:MAG: glycine betaine ABC transporter substrate-binding protein, partial [Solirubrobacteraceae bacterium]